MGAIHVMIIEPDQAYQDRLMADLSREADMQIVGAWADLLSAYRAHAQGLRVDVLLVDVDRLAVTEIRTWVAIRVFWPCAREVAVTKEAGDHILASVVGAGASVLYCLPGDPASLCQAVRQAARGSLNFDPWLVEQAKRTLLQSPAPGHIRFGALVIDLAAQEVTLEGNPFISRLRSSRCWHTWRAMLKGRSAWRSCSKRCGGVLAITAARPRRCTTASNDSGRRLSLT